MGEKFLKGLAFISQFLGIFSLGSCIAIWSSEGYEPMLIYGVIVSIWAFISGRVLESTIKKNEAIRWEIKLQKEIDEAVERAQIF